MSDPPASHQPPDPSANAREGAPDVTVSSSANQRALNRKLAAGATVNALGTIAKSAQPLVLLAIARLYGPGILGAFAIATACTRFLESLLTSGFRDAMVMYGGRYAHDPSASAQDRLYQAVANAVLFSTGFSVVAVAVVVVAPSLVAGAFEDQSVSLAIRLAMIALPFTNLREIALAMIRSRMVMRQDAVVNGVIGPTVLLVLVVVGGLTSASVEVLMAVFVATEILTAIIAVVMAGRYFALTNVLLALRRPRFDTELAWFALPQNLNSTFNYFVTSLDVVMLGLFAVPTELVGFYSIASRALRELRSPRRSFSAILSPLVARLYHEQRLTELSYHFVTTSRWAFLVTAPVAAVLLILLPDVLRIFHHTYDYGTFFAVLLAVNPVLAAALGMAGNVLVMTGHSRLNLMNSVLAAIANVGLNVLLIPPLGLLGAALATMVAGVGITVLQVFEARYYVGLEANLLSFRKPVVAVLFALGPVLAAWLLDWGLSTTGERVVLTLVVAAIYVGALAVQGVDPEDRQMIVDLFKRKKQKRAGDVAA